jgi:hypothetical protein
VVAALLRVGVAEGDRAEGSAFFFWPALLGVAFFAVRAIVGARRAEKGDEGVAHASRLFWTSRETKVGAARWW